MFSYFFSNKPVTKEQSVQTPTNQIIKSNKIPEKFIELNKYINYLLDESDTEVNFENYEFIDTKICEYQLHDNSISKLYKQYYEENDYNTGLCPYCYMNYNFETTKYHRDFIKYINYNYTNEEIEMIFNLNEQNLF